MALPRPEIAMALFEAYLNIRKKREAEEMLPTIPAYKIKMCSEVLTKINNAKNFDDWINIIYACDAIERKEHEIAEKEWFGVGKYLHKKSLFFSHTAHAVLTYILSQLIEDAKFAALQDSLKKNYADLNKAVEDDVTHGISHEIIQAKRDQLVVIEQKVAALENSKDAPESFFQQIILGKKEAKAEELKEKSFADFQKNALNGSRPLTMCKKLMVLADTNLEKVEFPELKPALKKQVKFAESTHTTFSNKGQKNAEEDTTHKRRYNLRSD